MDILGNRRFVELPGSRMHELPPLLVRTAPAPKRLDRVVGMAADIVESEEILPPLHLRIRASKWSSTAARWISR